jgi:aspartate/methionine/tyrosine aminotransferase
VDINALISDRSRSVDASGIRRVFELAQTLDNPVNLSIGQPDFQPDAAVRAAAIAAIEGGQNGYSSTWGTAGVRSRIAAHLKADVGWDVPVTPGSGDGPELLVTSGTNGALLLACLALLGPGDEMIVPDPYFVCYPALAEMCGAKAITCDTYPDFGLTAERVEPLITERTKLVLANSPSNPAGVVMSTDDCRELSELCARQGVILLTDEIYDEFVFSDGRTEAAADPSVLGDTLRCPSPTRLAGSEAHTLLVRGFGKTYGVTGWRLGYAAGPGELIREMAKLQQYTFVCPPAPLQAGAEAAFGVDMGPQIAEYERRRDLVVRTLERVTEVATPGGAFYVFPKVPEGLGLSGTDVFERCVERNVLLIPGREFSTRDTHVRLSLTAPYDRLEEGVKRSGGRALR